MSHTQSLALIDARTDVVREYGEALLHAAFCLDTLRVRSAPIVLTATFTCNCEGLGVAVHPLTFVIRKRGPGARVAWRRTTSSGYPCPNPIASLLATLRVPSSANGSSKTWRWCALDAAQAIAFFAAVFSQPCDDWRVHVGKGRCFRRGPEGGINIVKM